MDTIEDLRNFLENYGNFDALAIYDWTNILDQKFQELLQDFLVARESLLNYIEMDNIEVED